MNNFEFLQDTLRKYMNLLVKEDFSDTEDIGDDKNATLTGRQALKKACTHLDTDTGNMTIMRALLFYLGLRKGQDLHPPLYSISIDSIRDNLPDPTVADRPKIRLYFAQDMAATPEGETPIQAEISFRLMDETPQSMTVNKARIIANKIKTEFGTNNGYQWTKGKIKVSYRDIKRGYRLAVLCLNELDAEATIRKVLEIQGHPFDSDFCNVVAPKKNSITKPTGTTLVYGKQQRNSRWRPIGKVRFRTAFLKIEGLRKEIALVDGTGFHYDALVKF